MTNRLTRPLAALALSGLAAGPALASSYERLAPDTARAIRAKLTAEGYEVRKIEAEDGMIEVYALRDGKRYELYLDRDLTVRRQKQDD